MLIARIDNLLNGRRFARSVAVLAGGTAIGQLLVVASAPLLSRLYTPSEFGVLAVYVSLLTFLLGIVTLRYYMAIPLANDDDAVAALLVLCVLVLGILIGGVAVATTFFGPDIASLVSTPDLEPFLWLLPVGLAGAGVIQVLTSWAIRDDHFPTLARVRIGQSSSMVISQIALAVMTHSGIGLIIGDVVGRTAGSVGLANMAWRQHRASIRAVTMGNVIRVANQYRRFPLISSWSAFVASASSQAPTLLVAAFYGPTVVGWFGLSQRLLSMSFVLVASAIGTVFLSESAKLAKSNRSGLMRLFWSTVSRSSAIATVMVVGVVIVSPLLFGPVLGKEWASASGYAQALAVSGGFHFVNRAVGSTVTVVERQDLDLLGESIIAVLAIGSLFMARSIEATPLTAVVLYSAAASLGSFLGIGISWYAIRQALRG